MIVADTSAIIALLDGHDRHHAALRDTFEDAPGQWVLPWAILPEVDYLAATALGAKVQDASLRDLADGLYRVEFGDAGDLAAAEHLHRRYRSLKLGLVDACVAAVAIRLHAGAIATLDLRHFGALALPDAPRLLPRDLSS
ncbi:MAG: type II toxin-antitoxin system VapC family toxin [Acidobacteriota bacterium]